MTWAHRLEGNLNYAYRGYLAGVELGHLLGNHSYTQLRFYNLTPFLSLVCRTFAS
jgi:hypothetical protein